MCGLVIFLSPRPVEEMMSALESIDHRGIKSTEGIVERGEYTLGHIRLPIQGLDPQYNQPFEYGRDAAVFVGEVFNLTGENDASAAMELIYQQGPGIADSFDGFFSLAYTDGSDTLYVMTDHLGIKPLYIYSEEGIISSELRGITSIVETDPDPIYYSNVLKWGYSPDNRTPYRGIVRILPGSLLKFVNGELKDVARYFELEANPDLDLRAEIEAATIFRLKSDLPIASLCSGGLDSTIVTMLAADIRKDITVFHVDNDEREFAEMVPLPAEVRREFVDLEAVDLDDVVRANQTPVDLGSMIPQYALAEAVARKGFHVCLSGDGADELFGGYRRAKEYDSQHSDVFVELPAYHLPRLDVIPMAFTIELRSPFLAPDVIRAALALPYSERQSKQALKKAFKGYVPDEILDRPKLALKSEQVIKGGIEYRKQLIETHLRVHYDY